MEDLIYDNIISELDSLFPEFRNDSNLDNLTEGLPGVHLTLFISYAREHWIAANFQDKLLSFIERLHSTQDPSATVIFNDFALDFQLHFEEHKTEIAPFLLRLSPQTQHDFQAVLKFWKAANQNIKTAGS